MRTVWKFPLELGTTKVVARLGYEVRSVGIDPATGGPAVWIEVTPNAAPSITEFVIYGTGHEHIEPPTSDHVTRFVGSVWQGPYVWHVYEWKYEPF